MPTPLPPDARVRATIAREGLPEIAEDMRTLDRAALAPHFAAASSGRIFLKTLIKGILWHVRERIRRGEEPEVFGNVRTLYYLWVKPVLAHIPDDDDVKTDPYKTFIDALSELVQEDRVCRYADFGFTDDNEEGRKIGGAQPEVLVFAEKRGFRRVLAKVHDDQDVSVLTLAGFPSALTTEYTALALEEAVGRVPRVRLFGIVDWDPSGDLIAKSFVKQLKACGVEVEELTLVVHPRRYAAEELEMFRFPLPGRQETKTDEWLAETGGIGGERYGLEAESLPVPRLLALIEEWV